MYERIKLVRTTLGLSQTAFGANIGVSLGVIRNLESNITTLTPPLLDLFCNIYGVNRKWLETGKGDMFLPRDNSPITALQKEYGLSPDATLIIQRFVEMNDEKRDEFLKVAKGLMK